MKSLDISTQAGTEVNTSTMDLNTPQESRGYVGRDHEYARGSIVPVLEVFTDLVNLLCEFLAGHGLGDHRHELQLLLVGGALGHCGVSLHGHVSWGGGL